MFKQSLHVRTMVKNDLPNNLLKYYTFKIAWPFIKDATKASGTCDFTRGAHLLSR